MKYLSDNFLLHTKTAQTLFHDHAEHMPILDYHCHLSPQAIAEDMRFETMTQIWLKGDHYKWRAMRANGIDEKCITGNASDEEKFLAWARTMPFAVRNPLFDWAHLELSRYFDISDTLLSEKTAASVFAACNEKLKDKAFSARNLLKRMNVRIVCTTDDPVDDLSWHAKIIREKFEITVLPTFRPDKTMAVEDPLSYNRYLDALSAVSNTGIETFTGLLEALDKRHGYFHEHGCRCSDHGFESLAEDRASSSDAEAAFSRIRDGKRLDRTQIAGFKATLLLELCKMNHKRGWVQQLHFGVIRNPRSRLFKAVGPDAGADSIGDHSFGRSLCCLLDALDGSNQLTKTILFNINSKDNELLACLAQSFQDGSSPGKIQFGPAWWFLDQKDGMIRHLDTLSNFGLLSRFIGMTTDSRSLLSFPRHEYFRRILCNRIGGEMELGDIPDDMQMQGRIVEDICYANAQRYFGY